MRVQISFSKNLEEILSSGKLTIDVIKSIGYFDKNFYRFLQKDKLEQLDRFNKSQYNFDLHFDNTEILSNQEQYCYKHYKDLNISFQQLLASREILIQHSNGITTNYNILTPWLLFHRSHHFLTVLDNGPKISPFFSGGYKTTEYLPYISILLNVKSCRAPVDYMPLANDIYADIFSAVISNTLKFKTREQITELIDFLKNTPEFRGQLNPLISPKIQPPGSRQNRYYKSNSLDHLIEFPEEIKNLAVEILNKEVEFLLDFGFLHRLSLILGLGFYDNSMDLLENCLYLCAYWQMQNATTPQQRVYVSRDQINKYRDFYLKHDRNRYIDLILGQILSDDKFNTQGINSGDLNLFLEQVSNLIAKIYDIQESIKLFLHKIKEYQESL